MKKHILPMLLALGIAAAGMAGLYCVLTFLSCYMDGDPSAHPVAWPASILGGLGCLALFALLIWGYVNFRCAIARENG